jgi:hypothetical protein
MTLNICGDVVTDEIAQAHRQVAGLALTGPATSPAGDFIVQGERRY